MTKEVETPRDGNVYLRETLANNEWVVERWQADPGTYETQYATTREVGETLACQIAEAWSVGAFILDQSAQPWTLELWSGRR